MLKYPNIVYIIVTLTLLKIVNNQCISTAVIHNCNIAYYSC